MGHGRPAALLAIAGALLAAGAAAVLLSRDPASPARPGGAPGARPRAAPAGAAPGAPDPLAAEEEARARAVPAPPLPEGAATPAPGTAEGAAPPGGGTPAPANAVADVHLAVESLYALLKDSVALPAEPEVDPSTGEAPAVAPGRPPEMALADFVAKGPGAVERAVVLAGERRPAVEEGVPVSLSGRVVDEEGGAPVAGARVVVTSTFYVRRYFYDHHLREVARAETGADGAFRIERLHVDPAHFGRGGRLYLTVTAEGRAPALALPLARVSPGVANRVRDVALARGGLSLRGRVLDYWEGRPVVGARVHATGAVDPVSYPKDERPALFVGAPTAVTDAEGRFLLEGLGKGLQVLSVHGGDDCIGRENAMLPAEGELLVRTRQIRGRIEGTTVDGDGEPVALVTVEGGDNSTHSFADGRFVLENFRGDAVAIRCTHPDFPPVLLEGVRDGTTGLVVRMERPRPEIVLEVVDRDTGAPVKRVRVEFSFPEGTAPPAATSPERLAPDGRFAVRVPEGATSLAVSAAGLGAGEVLLAGRVEGEVVRVALAPPRAE